MVSLFPILLFFFQCLRQHLKSDPLKARYTHEQQVQNVVEGFILSSWRDVMVFLCFDQGVALLGGVTLLEYRCVTVSVGFIPYLVQAPWKPVFS